MGFFSDLLDIIFHRIRPAPLPPPGPTPVPPDAVVDQVVSEVNRRRVLSGLPSLRYDESMSRVSQGWAESMALTGTLAHGDFSGRIASVYPNAFAGEDIAEGQTSAQEVVNDWMNDPPHRATILGNYTRIGVGYASLRSGPSFWVIDCVRA